jgi:uncharacterized membrane protein
VLLMIEAHVLDSWTRSPDRETATYRIAMILAGMGSVLFLTLAGVAVALSAGSKLRRMADATAATRAVAWRGLEIFLLAFLFRLQAWILGWSDSPRDLLKVDVLNVMGPAIVATALLWRLGRSVTSRCIVFALSAAAVAFITPVVRSLDLSALPDPLEAYITPIGGLSNFVFFPWLGLVFAGASMGVLIDGTSDPHRERKLNVWLAACGALLAIAAGVSSLMPSLYRQSLFWTTSPSYFFIRAGVVAVLIAASYAWNDWFNRAHRSSPRVSPITQLGKTSLFIYWIHVELVYGLISRPIHHQLTLTQASIAYVLITALMLACSIGKERLVQRFRTGNQSGDETLIAVRRITS